MKIHRITRLSILPVISLLITACQPAVYMMPAPVGLHSGKHDPFAFTPESERSSTIKVGYATNRQPLGARQSRFYGRNFDQDIRMGVADVRIGTGNKSWEEIQQLSLKGTTDRHEALLSLEQVHEQGELKAGESLDVLTPELEELFAEFNRAIEDSPTKEITIYVHGANNNFYRTASQAAQYRHFTGRQAIVVLYSWPSAESIIHYGTDIRHIIKTVPTFVRFIKLLSKHTTARRINILAYSAGATLATKSLAVLGRDTTQPDRDIYRKTLRLGAIYFAAPDTDFDSFVEEYHSYQDIVDTVTMTMNRYDSVLGIAMADHRAKSDDLERIVDQESSGKSRLGKPDLDDLTREQRDWIIEQTKKQEFTVIDIDPTQIPGMSKGSHDYWYKSPWVSTDTLLDLNLHAPPQQRALVSADTPSGARIWYFPADYEQRVDEAIDKLTREFHDTPGN